MAQNPYRAPQAQVTDRLAETAGQKLTWQQILFSFDGRISRNPYWMQGVLPLLGAALVLGLIGTMLGAGRGWGGLINLVLLWPGLAISIKRWHDRDKSGWWVLITLIPVIGAIWSLVELGFLRGTAGTNRFGPDGTDLY